MLSPSTIPRGLGPPRTSGARHSGQVFGLVGTTGRSPEPGPDLLLAVASQDALGVPVLHDGGRSHSPLRGSPGFTPGSLLPRPAWKVGRTSCTLTISSASTSTKHLHVASACCRVPIVRGVRIRHGSIGRKTPGTDRGETSSRRRPPSRPRANNALPDVAVGRASASGGHLGLPGVGGELAQIADAGDGRHAGPWALQRGSPRYVSAFTLLP